MNSVSLTGITFIDWWLLPLSGASEHAVSAQVMWHGRLMMFAWGFCVPIALLVARYWKLWPKQAWPKSLDHKGWWHTHRGLQWLGLLATLGGYYLVYQSVVQTPTQTLSLKQWHASLGELLIWLTCLQIFSSFVRGSKGGPTSAQLRGDHFDMTTRRQWFERLHKSLGWGLLLIACLTLLMGLSLADAPRWMFLLLGLWWLGLITLASRWQRQGRCIDTYQAIWGADPGLPGLQRPPIGWGIRRMSARSAHQESRETPHSNQIVRSLNKETDYAKT
jgi:hypothetical protein